MSINPNVPFATRNNGNSVSNALCSLFSYRICFRSKQIFSHRCILISAVRAAEALIGAGHGEEKWKMALEKLSKLGLDINADAVLDAVKSAWYKLNLQQILAGIKEPEKNGAE